VDLPEFACDFSIADRIEEVAENGVRARVHVGALAVLLERLKFRNRVLLGHDVFDLRFELDHQFSLPSLRFDTASLFIIPLRRVAASRRGAWAQRSFHHQNGYSKSEVGAPDFRIVNEFSGGTAMNDAAGFHNITSISD
jgi:hypothetical protein